MPKVKSCIRTLEPIVEETFAPPVIRSVQRFGDDDEMPSKESDSSSHRSVVIVDESTSSASDIDVLETDPFFCLSRFESSLFATILEDVMMAFRILSECNNSLRVERVIDDTPKHLSKKYSIKPPAVQPTDLDLIDQKRLNCKEYKMQKLENDRNEIAEAIESTYVGLSLSRSLRPLWNKCQEVLDRKDYVEAVTASYAENKSLARILHRQLRQQRVQQRSLKYETDSNVEEKRKEVQDAELMSAIKERYTMKYQNARKEQHMEDISLKQGVFSDSISYHKRRSEHESIVHNEVEMLMNVCIQEIFQQIEEIMDKYEKDMETMDLKLQIMMSEVNKITSKNKELDDLYKGRDKDIKAWVKFKQDRAKAQKYHQDMTRSAISVQAWWRGLLVRKQMGPFRVRRKPKGKK